MSAQTAVQGGNLAYAVALNTTADAFGSTLYTYNKLTDVAKNGRPELENFQVVLTSADLTSAHETFLQANLVKVTQAEPVTISYTNNTEDSVAEAPGDVTPFFLASAGGAISSTEHRLYLAYGYFSDVTESNDAANTPVTQTLTFTSIGLPGEYTITKADIDALFSSLGTITTDVTLATGVYGKIVYLNK